MNSKENLVFRYMVREVINWLFSIKNLNINFIDVDYEIEKTGLEVSQILKKRRKYFREIEEIETLKILKNTNTVISLGGGAFLNNKIKKEVLNNHISFAELNVKTLVDRIKDSKRPIVHKSSINQIEELIKTIENLSGCYKITVKIHKE